MPKKQKRKKSIRRHRPLYKRPLFVVFLIVLAALGGLLFAKTLDDRYKTKETEETSETEKKKEEKESEEKKEEEKKETPAETPSDSPQSPDGKTPAAYDGEDSNSFATLTGSISTARFSGDNLIIRVNIDQYLSSGSCDLRVTDGVNQITVSAQILPEASTSTCEGFDVPTDSLKDFSRPLSVTINVTSGDKTGTITGSVQ